MSQNSSKDYQSTTSTILDIVRLKKNRTLDRS